MHWTRITALIGVIVAAVGLFLKALQAKGEQILEDIHAVNDAIPASLPTVWGGLADWAKIAAVIVAIVIIVLIFRPLLAYVQDRQSAGIMTVLGLGTLAYSVYKWIDTSGTASDLQESVGQAIASGAFGEVTETFTAGAGSGFLLTTIGTALVVLAGLVGLVNPKDAPVVERV